LRADRFLSAKVAVLVLSEALAVDVVTGILGARQAFPIIKHALGRMMGETIGHRAPKVSLRAALSAEFHSA
jgi:hypothetical protein